MPRRRIHALAVISVLASVGCHRAHPPRTRLVVAYATGTASLLPNKVNEEIAISIQKNVFDGLVEFDEGLALRPALAESWTTPDERTWIFRLRRGVRLHDGRVLDASQVAACLERIRRDPSMNSTLAAIGSIETRGPRSLVVHTVSPSALLPLRLEGVQIWAEPTAPGGPPVGTGAYRIRRAIPGGDTVLEAFDDCWRGRPQIQELVFRVIPDVKDRLALLRSGKVDLLVDAPAEEVPGLRRDSRLRTASLQGLRILFLGMDCSKNPFANLRVRRAVALAIDREKLVRGPLGGYGEIVDQLVAPQLHGSASKIERAPYDPAQARRLLKDSGYPDGFEVRLEYMAGKYRSIDAVVESIVKDLQAVGIVVETRPTRVDDFLERGRRREIDFYLLGWMTSSEVDLSYDYLLHTPEQGHGTFNFGGYSNRDMDQSLEAIPALTDRYERGVLLQRVAEKIREDAPVVPLYRQADVYAYARDLEFTPRLDRRILGTQIRLRPAGPGAAPPL